MPTAPFRLSCKDKARLCRDSATEHTELILFEMMKDQICHQHLTLRQWVMEKIPLRPCCDFRPACRTPGKVEGVKRVIFTDPTLHEAHRQRAIPRPDLRDMPAGLVKPFQRAHHPAMVSHHGIHQQQILTTGDSIWVIIRVSFQKLWFDDSCAHVRPLPHWRRRRKRWRCGHSQEMAFSHTFAGTCFIVL